MPGAAQCLPPGVGPAPSRWRKAQQEWPGEDTVGLCPGNDSSGPLPTPCECQPGCGPREAPVSLVQRPLTAQLPGVCGGGFFCQEVQNKGGRVGEKEEAELSAYPGA